MKLYVMKNGTLPLPKYVLNGAEAGLASGKEIVPSPVASYLIEHPEGNILFDVGNSIAFLKGIPDNISPLKHLEKINLTPDDIDYVVCSHLHGDHSGMLKHFLKSQIIVHEEEYTNVKKHWEQNTLNENYISSDVNDWFTADLNWNMVNGTMTRHTLVDGVEILSLGSGHSYGMLALYVHLPKSGGVVLTSDAVYCAANMKTMSGIMIDKDGYQSTVEYLAELAEQEQAQLWYGHDKDQFAEMVLIENGHYE